MPTELLFNVSGSDADPAEPISLSDAGLTERADLQEWVLKYPQMLGEDVRIVTFEFDRWGTTRGESPRDRLDVLGIGADGRLVVAELKRDVAPDTIFSQAMKYAAMASRFDSETLGEYHARYLTRRGEPTSRDEAWAQLAEHAPEIDESSLRRPRIVLLARDFPTQATAVAVWLNEMGVDVTLMRFQAYRAADRFMLTVRQLLPVPDVEEFTVAPQRAEARGAAGPARLVRRQSAAIRRLADTDAVSDGTVFTFRSRAGIPASFRERLTAWLAGDPRRGSARWRNDAQRPLVWEIDGQPYSPGGLVRAITNAAGEECSVEGTRYWVDPDGFDLVELAALLGGDRAELYLDFWSSLLEQLDAAHPDWPLPGAKRYNWLTFPAGYGVARWSISFAQGQRLRSELYFADGSPGGARPYYEQLAAVHDKVDAAYGSELSWEPLPDRKACRVADYRDGSPERCEEHDDYISWFIATQDRLRRAINSVAPQVSWIADHHRP